jgi:hypothetical protein
MTFVIFCKLKNAALASNCPFNLIFSLFSAFLKKRHEKLFFEKLLLCQNSLIRLFVEKKNLFKIA